jgi:hypothetical protein
VKVRFETDTGQVEHIWCWLRAIDGESMKVEIITYPHTQKAKIPLGQVFPLSALEDWQVEQRNGTLRGGYTQKVMFDASRDKSGQLPRELEEQRARFVDW